MKEQIYLNAFNLSCDGCTLFKNESYSSSNAPAILVLEELGKLGMVDHICDDMSLNSEHDSDIFLTQLFSRKMFLSRKYKQDSLYVGYSNHRVRSRRRVTSNKAYVQLAIIFNKIKDVDDLGFSGFDCWSDENSAKQFCLNAGKMFLSLKKPAQREIQLYSICSD